MLPGVRGARADQPRGPRREPALQLGLPSSPQQLPGQELQVCMVACYVSCADAELLRLPRLMTCQSHQAYHARQCLACTLIYEGAACAVVNRFRCACTMYACEITASVVLEVHVRTYVSTRVHAFASTYGQLRWHWRDLLSSCLLNS